MSTATSAANAASAAASSFTLPAGLSALSGDNLSIALTIVGLIGGIFTSAVVAYFQYKVPIWRDNRVYRMQKGILGDWYSSWSDTSKPGVWHTERVHIDVEGGKIVMTNTDSTGGYKWRGQGELHANGTYFYGVWRSLKAGSPSTGVFSFLVLSQGARIVGQAFGPDQDSSMIKSDWAMGRTIEEMEIAKTWLARYTRLLPATKK